MSKVPNCVLDVVTEKNVAITFEISKTTTKDAKVIYFDDEWVVLEVGSENCNSYYLRTEITGFTVRQKHINEEIMRRIQEQSGKNE